MLLNATEIKGVYNIDGKPKKYQQMKSEAIGFKGISIEEKGIKKNNPNHIQLNAM